ncbi:MAG: hypothetical protein F6K35_18715, partial [Okeania sp. SIO2H7]|nr:hypothetical protein [Okeania sp. SIO2H7]
KRTDCDRALKYFRAMEDIENFTSIDNLKSGDYLGLEINNHRYVLEPDSIEQPMTTMKNAAIATATKCIHFRNGHYREYLRIQKRCTRAIRLDPELKYLGINDDGSLWKGGRGKGTRQSNKRNRLDTS